MPTRLLDLGEHGVRRNPRFIISDEHFGGPHDNDGFRVDENSHWYVTLSHCWGTSSVLKLLQSNELLFRNSIAFNRLPKSFRHAIEVTRLLGMRYLWIDSLCIIQDSLQDWREEAAVMLEIYRNSFCNIAATAASNSSIGLFFTQNPDVFSITVVKPDWTEASDGEFAIVQPHEELMQKFNKEPLLQRAVHFTEDQVFFECRQYLACEVYPCEIPYPHGEDCKKCVRNYFIHCIVNSRDEDFPRRAQRDRRMDQSGRAVYQVRSHIRKRQADSAVRYRDILPSYKAPKRTVPCGYMGMPYARCTAVDSDWRHTLSAGSISRPLLVLGISRRCRQHGQNAAIRQAFLHRARRVPRR